MSSYGFQFPFVFFGLHPFQSVNKVLPRFLFLENMFWFTPPCRMPVTSRARRTKFVICRDCILVGRLIQGTWIFYGFFPHLLRPSPPASFLWQYPAVRHWRERIPQALAVGEGDVINPGTPSKWPKSWLINGGDPSDLLSGIVILQADGFAAPLQAGSPHLQLILPRSLDGEVRRMGQWAGCRPSQKNTWRKWG